MKPVHIGSRAVCSLALLAVSGLAASGTRAHSVGQVDTALYFDSATESMLISRALAGGGGLMVGDVLTYIIEFVPVENGATVGAGGYVTAYIPAGTEVVGADFVIPDGLGGFAPSTPNFPGITWDGFGRQGANSYPGYTTTDPNELGVPGMGPVTAACAAIGEAIVDCNGRMMQVYADTGIFFSNDARTAVFVGPDTDGVVRVTNGYHVDPSAEGMLVGILGIPDARTHNLWDASQTNAFGGDVPAATPRSTDASFAPRGPTPFNAGSPVAGRDSGYWLDNTGEVGPWRRIQALGSTIGTNSDGAADVRGMIAVFGSVTTSGLVVSPSSPLTAVNAIRWAVGRLNVGEIRHVRLRLRVTASPGSGIQVSTEVFGGDSANAAGKDNKDNPWRYHVPSLATARALDLILRLEPILVNGLPYAFAPIPVDATVRYRLTYANFGGSPHTNVVLAIDTPAETAGCPVPTASIAVISGSSLLPHDPTCETTLGAGDTFAFATIPTLPAGGSGEVEFDLVSDTADGDILILESTLDSTESTAPIAVRSALPVSADAYLQVVASVVPSSTIAGTTLAYTVVVTNQGFVDASEIDLDFILPANGPTAADRFSFVAGSDRVAGFPATVPTVVNPPTQPAFAPEPRDQIHWDFGGARLAPRSSFVITFDAIIGTDVPASSEPYYSATVILYDNGDVADYELTNAATAPVLVTSPDSDDDGIPDDLDPDDDNDGILDVDEVTGFTGDPSFDTDSDGIPDYRDPDHVPGGCVAAGTPPACTMLPMSIDFDGDGLPNHLDRDADGDGITDALEAGGTDADGDGVIDGCIDVAPRDGLCDMVGAGLTPGNTDSATGDTAPDYLDLDSDGDGIFDAVEAHDSDGDGAPEFISSGNDHDGDGIDDAFDGDCTAVGVPVGCAAAGDPVLVALSAGRDSDGNGTPDWQQVCLDGYVSGTEACDDGNTEDTADACSNSCLRNNLERCTASSQCVNLCDSTSMSCQPCVDDAMGTASVDTGCMSSAAIPICDTSPTLSVCEPCVDTGLGTDDGCTMVGFRVCDISTGPNACVPCLDSDAGTGMDDGCMGTSLFCIPGASPSMNRCVLCLDSDAGVGMDAGCSATSRYCDVSLPTRTCEQCEDSAIMGDDRGCSGMLNVCDEVSLASHTCIDCFDSDAGGGIDDGCDAARMFCAGTGTSAECRECRTDRDCTDPANPSCDPSGTCGPRCRMDSDCSGATPVCDLGALVCVECNMTSDCTGAAEPVCDTTLHVCRPCLDTATGGGLDSGCMAAAPVCVDPGPAGHCEPCADTATGTMLDDGCDTAAPVCDEGAAGGPTCVECTLDSHCPFACDTASGRCITCVDTQPGGGQDDGCAAAEPICRDSGTLTAACALCVDTVPASGLDDGCIAATPICDETGGTMGGPVCRECLVNADCPAGACDPTTFTCGSGPDTDGDGIPDEVDIDDDNDGILDTVESGGVDRSIDSDMDGTPDYADPDAVTCPDVGGDGVCDRIPVELDFDQDGVPNHLDLDADGDGIVDSIEGHDADGDGVPDVIATGSDMDNDGLDDAWDPDAGGSMATVPDHDADTAPDFLDLDSDGDGISDVVESNDADMDGVADFVASGRDADMDGIDDAYDTSEGGMSPAQQDTDGDGRVDYLDIDSDGDGIEDRVECPEAAACTDTDSDGSPDYLDIDADGDGIRDEIEGHDVDHDGMADVPPTGMDSDGDGLDDAYDPDSGGVPAPTPDTDGDGAPDYQDVDDDDDGIDTGIECPDSSVQCPDSDSDGVPDYLEPNVRGTLRGGACSASGGGHGGSLPWALLFFGIVALAFARRRRGMIAALLLVAAVLVPASADAQAVHLDHYRSAEAASDGFALSRPEDLGHLTFAAQLHLDYAYNPLVFELIMGDNRTEVASIVEHQLAAQVNLAFGLVDRVVIYAGLPVNFLMDGSPYAGVPGADGLTLSDVHLGLRGRLFGEPGEAFAMALQLDVTFPTAQAANETMTFAGEDGVVVHPEVVGEARIDILRITGNLGARIRATDRARLMSLAVSHELTWGLGITVAAVEDLLDIHGEIFGATTFENFGNRETSPVEILLGAKLQPTPHLYTGLAIGTGISSGYGAPDIRAILNVGWAEPRAVVREEEPEPGPSDRDGDGLMDDVDGCPDEPEDMDDFEDDDGCPDPDNDGDGILDDPDECPNEPEDMDDFEDENGCPDPDNDADGLLDTADQCPNEPEDVDGFEDQDGCPDIDNDADRVHDVDDRCPMEPGPVEEQGCPVNIRVDHETGQIVILQRVEFATNRDRILERSQAVLRDVLNVLLVNTTITRVRVEGHTDTRGRDSRNLDLSRRRAEAVRRWLIDQGLAPARMEAYGCGELNPIDTNETASGRQSNRRVEFQILEPVPPTGLELHENCPSAADAEPRD